MQRIASPCKLLCDSEHPIKPSIKEIPELRARLETRLGYYAAAAIERSLLAAEGFEPQGVEMKKYNADYPSGTWIGVGGKIQAQASLLGLGGGAGSMLCCVVSVDHPLKNMAVKFAWGNNKGYNTGLGVSEDVVMVLITSLYDPNSFFLTEPLGFDLQLDAGVVIGPATGQLRGIASRMRALGLKNVKVADLRFLASRIEPMLSAYSLSTIGFGKTARPKLQMLSTTVGAGLGVGAWSSTPAAAEVLVYPS